MYPLMVTELSSRDMLVTTKSFTTGMSADSTRGKKMMMVIATTKGRMFRLNCVFLLTLHSRESHSLRAPRAPRQSIARMPIQPPIQFFRGQTSTGRPCPRLA